MSQKKLAGIHSYSPVVPSKTIPYSRPKWAKCSLVFRPKRTKNPTLWGGTYLYDLYMGVHPPPPALQKESIRIQWTKTLCQNNLKNIALFFTFFKGYRCNQLSVITPKKISNESPEKISVKFNKMTSAVEICRIFPVFSQFL